MNVCDIYIYKYIYTFLAYISNIILYIYTYSYSPRKAYWATKVQSWSPPAYRQSWPIHNQSNAADPTTWHGLVLVFFGEDSTWKKNGGEVAISFTMKRSDELSLIFGWDSSVSRNCNSRMACLSKLYRWMNHLRFFRRERIRIDKGKWSWRKVLKRPKRPKCPYSISPYVPYVFDGISFHSPHLEFLQLRKAQKETAVTVVRRCGHCHDKPGLLPFQIVTIWQWWPLYKHSESLWSISLPKMLPITMGYKGWEALVETFNLPWWSLLWGVPVNFLK